MLRSSLCTMLQRGMGVNALIIADNRKVGLRPDV